jgi:hypothetical protein
MFISSMLKCLKENTFIWTLIKVKKKQNLNLHAKLNLELYDKQTYD